MTPTHYSGLKPGCLMPPKPPIQPRRSAICCRAGRYGANDPYAKADKNTKFITSPPHFMAMLPFGSKTTGLPMTPKKTGSWIMWAETRYAHLMVNQVP